MGPKIEGRAWTWIPLKFIYKTSLLRVCGRYSPPARQDLSTLLSTILARLRDSSQTKWQENWINLALNQWMTSFKIVPKSQKYRFLTTWENTRENNRFLKQKYASFLSLLSPKPTDHRFEEQSFRKVWDHVRSLEKVELPWTQPIPWKTKHVDLAWVDARRLFHGPQ